jgi:hypothetical protein
MKVSANLEDAIKRLYLGPLLEIWRRDGSMGAASHVADFVLDDFEDLALEGRLSNAFWEERETQERQAKAWLLDARSGRTLATAAERATGARADGFRRALDRWSRIPRGFERPTDPLRARVDRVLEEALEGDAPRWLFVTVSGAHLYGFPSADSDYDLRGAHVAALRDVVGLDPPSETLERVHERDGVKVELVSHDVGKYFRLLLNRNGYVLEQVFSPLAVQTSPEYHDLKEIARACITRGHAAHYLGFAEQQWRLTQRKGPTITMILYLYRVLLTGIHLMRTGEVEANLLRLNAELKAAHLDELIARKVAGEEGTALPGADMAFYEREYLALRRALHEAGEVAICRRHRPDAPPSTTCWYGCARRDADDSGSVPRRPDRRVRIRQVDICPRTLQAHRGCVVRRVPRNGVRRRGQHGGDRGRVRAFAPHRRDATRGRAAHGGRCHKRATAVAQAARGAR